MGFPPPSSNGSAPRSEKKAKKKSKKKTKKAKKQHKRVSAEAVADLIAAAGPASSKAKQTATDDAAVADTEPAVQNGGVTTGEDSDATNGGGAGGGAGAAATATATAAAGDSGKGSETTKKKEKKEKVTFQSLGVCKPLCKAVADLKWTLPTPIQAESLPVALAGRDVIGLAETGSGKTAAFAIPILQALLAKPQRLFAVVMAPTRELAVQIGEQFNALGAGIGAQCAVVVGGVDMIAQQVILAKKPHIVIATPGRLIDHLENTKGFHLRNIKFLVLDEADRMLSMDFEEEINKVLQVIPRDRRTYLFSATMTSKVAKLQRASLQNPVKCEVSTKYSTVSTLVQNYLFLPAAHKECYLAYVLNEFAGQSGIVFVAKCATAQRTVLMLRNLGFSAICLHGQMTQHKRLAALNKFKAGERTILVATDVAARGLDIPSVDVVINFDVPQNAKDYVHRVGRTARAGRAGRSITFVCQYDVEPYQRIERLIGKRLPAFPYEEATVLVLLERVSEAMRMATNEMRQMAEQKGGGGRGGGRGRKRRMRGFDEAVDDAAAAVIQASEMKRKRLSLAVAANKRRAKRS